MHINPNSLGNPVMARTTAPIYLIILILSVFIALLFLIRLVMGILEKKHSSPEWLRKEAARTTKARDVRRIAKKNGLSPQERAVLADICRLTKTRNIYYLFDDRGSVVTLFRDAYRLMSGKDYSERQIADMFALLYRIERILAQEKRLQSTRRIPAGTQIFFITEDGEKFPAEITGNDENALKASISGGEGVHGLDKVAVTFRTESGQTYLFRTTVIRTEQESGGKISAILAHPAKFDACSRRHSLRRKSGEKCQFRNADRNGNTVPVEGILHDISGGGCCIHTALPVRENQRISIILPWLGAGTSVPGTIRRTRKLRGGGYSLHIKFDREPSADRNRILAYVYDFI